MLRLTHFTDKPLRFDPTRQYDNEKQIHWSKPQGLWLSDESDHGWTQWCQGADFQLESLAFATVFECDTSQWCVINKPSELIDFTSEYGTETYYKFTLEIDWKRVMRQYAGILITPYQWKLRLNPQTHWYYSWDCASACVWDLTSVRALSNRELLPAR